MNIRPYTDNDLSAVVAVFTEAIHSLGRTHYDAEQRAAWAPADADLAEWRSRLDALETLLAVSDDGALAGFLSFENDGHVDLLYTSPMFARQGVASMLYRETERQLRSIGVASLFTEASLVAAPFFSAHGFEVVEEQRVERRGVIFRRFAMRKTLA